MLSGINFSPPIYFFLNYVINLLGITTIEQLRMESTLWLITGSLILFFNIKKMIGFYPAIFSTFILISQSNLLLEQAIEARNYTMFYACGAWVLAMQCSFVEVKRHSLSKSIFLFLSHFSLCLVHYLGLIFSILAGFALLFLQKKQPFTNRIPVQILICWFCSLIVYLTLLKDQTSHLNSWNKSNGFYDLIDSYNSSFLFLTLVIFFLFFGLKKNWKMGQNFFCLTLKDKILILINFLGFNPFFFWILSHLSP